MSNITYVDRGDAEAYDFVKNDLTRDGAWHDMDLSAVVGARKRLTILRLALQNVTVQSSVEFRTKGYTGAFNQSKTYTYVSNVPCEQSVTILTDTSGIIQYRATNNVWGQINILVKGWFE